MRYAIALVICIILLATPASAASPGSVHVLLPDGSSYIDSTSPQGSLTVNGLTIVWNVGAECATINITGSFTTSWLYPYIDIAWFNTSAVLPMIASITSSTAGTYDLSIPFIVPGGSWDHSLSQAGLTGDRTWEHIFPAFERMDFEIGLNDQSTPYNMEIILVWDSLTPVEAQSWGSIKVLYRD